MTSFFRIGFVAYTTVVVLIEIGAYTGGLPTAMASVPHADKWMHLVLIGGIAFFLDGAIRHRPLWRGRGSLAAAAVLMVAGIEEWAQRFSSRRESSWADFAADFVGVMLFVWLARRLTSRTRPEPGAHPSRKP